MQPHAADPDLPALRIPQTAETKCFSVINSVCLAQQGLASRGADQGAAVEPELTGDRADRARIRPQRIKSAIAGPPPLERPRGVQPTTSAQALLYVCGCVRHESKITLSVLQKAPGLLKNTQSGVRCQRTVVLTRSSEIGSHTSEKVQLSLIRRSY